MASDSTNGASPDPVAVCPSCGCSVVLSSMSTTSDTVGIRWYSCNECGWGGGEPHWVYRTIWGDVFVTWEDETDGD